MHSAIFQGKAPATLMCWSLRKGCKLLLPGWPKLNTVGLVLYQPWPSQGKLHKSGSFEFRWLLSAVHSGAQTQRLSGCHVLQTLSAHAHMRLEYAVEMRVFWMYWLKANTGAFRKHFICGSPCCLLHPLPHMPTAHTRTHAHREACTPTERLPLR